MKVNEADMDITRVDDGVTLAKMLLCQLCGIPMTDKITLADEVGNGLETSNVKFTDYQPDSTFSSRPEVRLLQNAVDLSEQGTKIIQAEYLPHVALTGGYMVTNPNVYNGFQKRFSGVWNVGVTVQVPVWNWFEGRYKVRASRAATSMARMELSDVQEKINLSKALRKTFAAHKWDSVRASFPPPMSWLLRRHGRKPTATRSTRR